jgi:hypothetical protein
MGSGRTWRLLKIDHSSLNSGVLMWSSFWSGEKQTAYPSKFFYPNRFKEFSDRGYSLALRDIDRVGAMRNE